MKLCPLCDTAYPNHHTNCPTDGAMLIESRELEPGTVVRSKYRIGRVLGRGGMGTVYLAQHLLLDQPRALKFMSAELSQDPKFLKRFCLEAMAATKLRHPNVIEVVDLDQAEDGSPFIAMEYAEGAGLRQAMADAPFPVERALSIARGVALGLALAHDEGVIHRDIKPENILLAKKPGKPEVPKILDFGIAAMKESATAVSHTRGLMLTPEYASPEQWKGTPAGQLDGRVDLYALGGVLYEMLTGRTSFHAHNTEGWLYQHLQVAPEAPSKVRPDLAGWNGLDELVLRLLEKDCDRRTASAEQFVRELDAVRSGKTQVLVEHPQTIAKTSLEKSPDAVLAVPISTVDQARPALVPAPPEDRSAVVQEPKAIAGKRAGKWQLIGAACALLIAIATYILWLRFQPSHAAQNSQPQEFNATSNIPSTLGSRSKAPQSSPVQQPVRTTSQQTTPGTEEPKQKATETANSVQIPRRPAENPPTNPQQQTTTPTTSQPSSRQPPTPIETGSTWTDPATGLMWTQKDTGKDMTWDQAVEYCRELRLDRGAWRLPTLDELKAIHDVNGSSPWKVKGDLQITGIEWSSTRNSSWGAYSFAFWTKEPNSGQSVDRLTYTNRALCVHR
jgi:serine/threonine-protein kinase